MHSRAVLRGGRRIPAGLQELKVEDQEQRNILVDDRTDYANTVPLEEAPIVDNPRQRRNLMLSILNENPGQYANLLSQARLNEDVEVVHYAATAMAQISAKEDIALQQRMEEYERNRDSDEALDRYRDRTLLGILHGTGVCQNVADAPIRRPARRTAQTA